MSSTVIAPSGLEISSNSDSAASMVESLTPQKEQKAPRVLVDEGKEVKEADSKLSQAASELGKKGGEAAAAKRAEVKARPIPEKPAEVDEGEEARKRVSAEIEGAPPEKRKELASDRVKEATRKAAQLERELSAERSERERLARELHARTAPAPEAPPAPKPQPQRESLAGPAPKEEDFDDWAQFLEARSRWAARDEFETQRQKERAVTARQARQVGIQADEEAFKERLAGVKADDPEYLPKVAAFMETIDPELHELVPSYALGEGERVGPANVLADAIVLSDHAPGLLLYFTEHRDQFQRLATLRTSPEQIFREVARIEGRLEGATPGTPPPEREVSKARPPVRPVTGSPHTAAPDLHGDMDFDTFMTRRKKA